MATTTDGDGSAVKNDEASVTLRAHSTSPKRTVFTEPDNNDGWISTDLTVDVRR